MALFRFGDDTPHLAPGAWIAESATVLGRVAIGGSSSVWYGAVLRGDNDWIRIGARSNVQDGAVLHTDVGKPLTLGDHVTVGHQVMLHGCTIGDGTLVGMQSVVLNGARIGRFSMVGAGSLVTEDKEFPDGVLLVGRPAKVVRDLSPEQIARARASAEHYVELSVLHRSRLQRVDAGPT